MTKSPNGVEKLRLRIDAVVFPAYSVTAGLNGLGHVRRAVNFASLVAQVECPDSLATVILGAALHDIGRLPAATPEEESAINRNHGDRGAAIALPLIRKYFPEYDADLLGEAIAKHNRGLVCSDPIVASIWDGDRLDLFRLRDELRLDLFSTATARLLVPYAKRLLQGGK